MGARTVRGSHKTASVLCGRPFNLLRLPFASRVRLVYTTDKASGDATGDYRAVTLHGTFRLNPQAELFDHRPLGTSASCPSVLWSSRRSNATNLSFSRAEGGTQTVSRRSDSQPTMRNRNRTKTVNQQSTCDKSMVSHESSSF